MPLPDSREATERFIASLDSVPWFSRIGQPIPDDEAIHRIDDWEQWPGPEHPSVDVYCLDLQRALDDILRDQPELKPEWESLWRRCQESVIPVARSVVPYDPLQDSWHGPTLAVWSAAFTAALIALHIQIGREPPTLLQSSWQWYLKGHWPCGYATSNDNVHPTPLMVL